MSDEAPRDSNAAPSRSQGRDAASKAWSRPASAFDPLDRARSFARVAASLGIVTEAPRVGPYPLLRRLGAGGMGIVYAALDRELGRQIAVKVLRQPGDPEVRERLKKEARTLARLSHPNVVTVHRVGSDGGRTFIAMSLVEGSNLSEWRRARDRSLEEVLALFRQVGLGLAAAHDAGIVHRDFKPANVLVDGAGRARVADFGIASASPTAQPTEEPEGDEDGRSGGVGADALTRRSRVLGTPAFMAPEQYESASVGPPADQYAFCLSLVDVLAGQLPYSARAAEGLALQKAEGRFEPPDIGRVPTRLWKVLRRGLAPDPRDRFPDMRALLRALDRASRPPRWRVVALSIVGLSLAVIGALAVGSQAGAPQPSPAATDPCPDFEGQAAERWNAATRSQVSDAFGRSGLDMAPDMLEQATSIIEARLTGWAERKRVTCQRERLGLIKPRQLDARQRCLDARLRETEAAIELLRRADRATVQAAPAIARAEPLTTCDIPWNSFWLQRWHPSGEHMPRARALRDRVEEAQALVRSAGPDEARQAFDAIISELGGRDAPSVRAELFRLRSQLEPDPARRERLLGEALDAAISQHDVRSTVATSIDLAALARSTRHLELSREWVDFGLAENVRYRRTFADDPSASFWTAAFEAELLNLRGLNEQAAGQTDAALHTYAASVQALDPVAESFPVRLANGLNNIAETHRLLGQYEQALPYYDRAVTEAEAHLGAHHPTLAAVLGNRAAARIDMGLPALAHPDLLRAIAILENVEGPESGGLVVPVINLGLVHQARGELEPAEAKLRRGVALAAKNLGEGHPFTAYARGMVGAVVRDAGRPEEGLPLIEGAVGVMQRVFPNGHALSAAMLTERAETRRQLDELDGAEADARRAIEILDATGGAATPAHAVARSVLGHTLADRGDLAAARIELDAAVEQLETIGPPNRPELLQAKSIRGALELEGTR